MICLQFTSDVKKLMQKFKNLKSNGFFNPKGDGQGMKYQMT